MIIITTTCDKCPLCSRGSESRTCSVATPAHRPIPDDTTRPTWCPLRKEQVIIRDFK